MRVARAVVEGEGGRGPRLRRAGWGGCGDLVVCWVDGGCGGGFGAESLLGERWAWFEAKGWPAGAWVVCWVVVVVGVEDP